MLVAFCSCTSSRHVQLSKEDALRNNLTHLRGLLDRYVADEGQYPANLHDLVTSGYLTELPLDPITERNDTWVPIYEDVSSMPDPKMKPGVYDVRSGAKGSTLDGKPYEQL